MAGPPWELDVSAVREQPVRRAALFLYIGTTVVVLDADSGQVVALPDVPKDGMQTPLALSPDGTRLLFWCIEQNGRSLLLVVRDLASGERRRLPGPPGCFDRRGALSPDGHAIAALADAEESHEDVAAIDVVDVASSHRRRLWYGVGGASDPTCSIAWSPDGRLVAATYYHIGTDESATVVVDANTGEVVAHHEYRVLLGCPNGTWVDDQRIVLADVTRIEGHAFPEYVVDVSTGAVRHLPPAPRSRKLAFLNGRALTRDHTDTISIRDLDGENPRPLLILPPRDAEIRKLDVSSLMLGEMP